MRVTTFVADVAEEKSLVDFREDTAREHGVDYVNLLFNNAGVGGGGSFVAGSRQEWERTFNICWGGIYNATRVFLASLIRAREAHLINISSVNGFWATLGPETPHTAYSAAKFAVKGFTEALIGDLRMNAPHVSVSLVMPGHIGTSIVHNTISEFASNLGGEEKCIATERAEAFLDKGLTPQEAAKIILEGVQADQWRILVGPDAHALDVAVRLKPENAYRVEFYNQLSSVERR